MSNNVLVLFTDPVSMSNWSMGCARYVRNRIGTPEMVLWKWKQKERESCMVFVFSIRVFIPRRYPCWLSSDLWHGEPMISIGDIFPLANDTSCYSIVHLSFSPHAVIVISKSVNFYSYDYTIY